MSKYKLSAVAKISLEEAQETIDDYFAAFPGISGLLNAFGKYGLDHGYIMTAKPFNRRRYFEDYQRIEWDRKYAGVIERASKNMPIQGSASDICKIALILIYWNIKDNNLWDKAKIVAQVHDQISTNATIEFAEEWLNIVHKCMCDAANFIIPGDILGADTNNTGNCWSK